MPLLCLTRLTLILLVISAHDDLTVNGIFDLCYFFPLSTVIFCSSVLGGSPLSQHSLCNDDIIICRVLHTEARRWANDDIIVCCVLHLQRMNKHS